MGDDPLQPEPEAPAGPAPPPGPATQRRWRMCIVCGCLLWLLPLVAGIGVYVGRDALYEHVVYPGLVNDMAYDCELTLRGAGGEALDAAPYRAILAARLFAADIVAQVRTHEGELWIQCLQQDAERVTALVGAEFDPQLHLVAELTSDARAEVIAALRRGDPGAVERYALIPYHAPDDELECVVELPGIGAGAIASAAEIPNEMGLPTLLLTMTPAGGEALHALTSANVGRMLALSIGGRVRSTPVLMSAVRNAAQVDGGLGGWDSDELERFVIAAEHPLPAPLAVVEEQRIGRD